MGTIQNLTRCKNVVPLLRETSVVYDALVPVLNAAGSGEQHEVMRAEALMAITNRQYPALNAWDTRLAFLLDACIHSHRDDCIPCRLAILAMSP